MRLGTRRSALALAQAGQVARLLGDCEIVPMSTGGDRGAGPADKSRWVAELQDALAAGEVDLAVHSAKDVPAELGEGLELFGAPPRAAAQDALCGARTLSELPERARVGTSSLRRCAQLLAARGDLEVVGLRGNVDTRLARLADPEERLDAIVLARAGLERLGRVEEAGGSLDPASFVPAPGQGSLALQGRRNDTAARAAVAAISDPTTLACLRSERRLARELAADCDTPLGAHATAIDDGRLLLRAWVGLPDGSAWLSEELSGELSDPERLAREAAQRMLAAGAGELLAAARETSGAGR